MQSAAPPPRSKHRTTLSTSICLRMWPDCLMMAASGSLPLLSLASPSSSSCSSSAPLPLLSLAPSAQFHEQASMTLMARSISNSNQKACISNGVKFLFSSMQPRTRKLFHPRIICSGGGPDSHRATPISGGVPRNRSRSSGVSNLERSISGGSYWMI